MSAPPASTSVARVLVDLGAVRYNFRRLAKLAGVPLIAVVKADAYGHGASEIAGALAGETACAGFAVARLEEALHLREYGCQRSILVLGFFPGALEGRLRDDYLGSFCDHRLEPSVSSRDDLRLLLDFLSAEPSRRLDWHLEFDTGMKRAGLPLEELEPLGAELAQRGLRPRSVFSHLVESERVGSPLTMRQIELFSEVSSTWRKRELCRASHLANSCAVLQLGACGGSLARPGGALYGLDLQAETASQQRPAMRVSSRLVLIRRVEAGDAVGYGGRWRAPRRQLIGLAPFGYADGLSPSSANEAGDSGTSSIGLLLRGRRAPIVGSMSMDLTVVDLAAHPDAAVGDEVVVLGRQGNATIEPYELARTWGTVAYDVTGRLARRAERTFFAEPEPAAVENEAASQR